jgi:hypothetical protein
MLRTKINEYIVMYLRISDPEKGFHGNWKADASHKARIVTNISF